MNPSYNLKLVEHYSKAEKRKITQLVTDDGVIFMSNTLYETQNMLAAARWFKNGRALIGGLGLGIIVKMIGTKAHSIDIVEIDKAVIDAVYPAIATHKTMIYLDDVERFPDFLLEELDWRQLESLLYDFVFLDVWPDLDYLRLPVICSLEDRYRPWLREGGRIISWGKYLMRKAYKAELQIYVDDLRKGNHTSFPDDALDKIRNKRPYFYSFCEWLSRQSADLWLVGNRHNEMKIARAKGRFLCEFEAGKHYLGIAEPSHSVMLDYDAIKKLERMKK